MTRAARGADKALIADARIFDRYVGDKIAAGKASLALSVTLQPKEATLTDEAIGKIRHQLTGILAKMDAGQIAAGGARALRLFS